MRNRRYGRQGAPKTTTMPIPLTQKSLQQDVVAEFVTDHRLETCMYVYLDAFMDIHRANSPPDFGETWCPHIIYSMLEKVYKGIRRELSEKGLLTNEAAGEYLMRTEPKTTT